jgi:hypothetical protein
VLSSVDFDGTPVGLGSVAGWPDWGTARFALAG